MQGQANKTIGTCKIDDPNLVCDIAANPRRASLQSPLISISVLADNPNSKSRYRDFNLPLNSMMETARNGWVADYIIGQLAQRNVSRVSFKEENGQVVKDASGNPVIRNDIAAGINAGIVGTALSNPHAKFYEIGSGSGLGI